MIGHNNDLTEIIRYITCSFKEINTPLSELHLQKIIYKLKMELGVNHPLYEKLPFYWYTYGPYSQPVTHISNTLKQISPASDDRFLLTDKYWCDK